MSPWAAEMCFNNVQGPISGSMYCLSSVGWNPVSYDMWISDQGAEWAILRERMSSIPLVHALQYSAQRL